MSDGIIEIVPAERHRRIDDGGVHWCDFQHGSQLQQLLVGCGCAMRADESIMERVDGRCADIPDDLAVTHQLESAKRFGLVAASVGQGVDQDADIE